MSLLATHGRPSTMTTLSGPSCAITHVPTIGSKAAGGLPDLLLAQIDLDRPQRGAARRVRRRKGRYSATGCMAHDFLLQNECCAGDRCRPDPVEHRRRPARCARRADVRGRRLPRARPAASRRPARRSFRARPPACRHAARRRSSAELVPDLAVVRLGLLEQPDRRRRHVAHVELRQHAPQLRRSRGARDRIGADPRARGGRLDAQRRARCCGARPRRLRRTSSPRFSDEVPAGVPTCCTPTATAAAATPTATDSRSPAPDRHAKPSPDAAAETKPAAISARATSTTSSRTRPCWNSATMAVGVNPAARSQKPPWTAATKLRIQVPTVTPSVRMAAVEGCSVSAGGQRLPAAIVSPAFSRCPNDDRQRAPAGRSCPP